MTGVIVGIDGDLTAEQAGVLRQGLEELFPAVAFAIVTRCSSLVAFTFDAEQVRA